MIVNDPIADMLIQIKNAALARKRNVELPFSKLKFAVAITLKKVGYLESVERIGEHPKEKLSIALAYQDEQTMLTDVKRKSKPGLRLYVGRDKIPTVVGGMGVAILSTPKGVMTGKEAKKQGIGGELLCEIW